MYVPLVSFQSRLGLLVLGLDRPPLPSIAKNIASLDGIPVFAPVKHGLIEPWLACVIKQANLSFKTSRANASFFRFFRAFPLSALPSPGRFETYPVDTILL
jgi:hypothetical protein